jgi:hypothetical protein
MRKDRKSDHHGGVFVAIKNTFDSEEAEELKSTAEIIWAKLTVKGVFDCNKDSSMMI